MTAVARIATERVPNVVLIPSEAIFQRDGATVVYELDGSEFDERRVQISKRGKEQAIVASGIEPGDRIATRRPVDGDDQEVANDAPPLPLARHRPRRRGDRGRRSSSPCRVCRNAANTVPTALVTKGPLKVTVHANGELRAGRTMTLVTPPVGGMLRIVQMKTTGMPVKSGEIVMEFDPGDQVYALEQAKSEVAEAEQEIVKMKADADVQKAQDDVALLTARFDVRRGRARCQRQRAHPRGRGAEERADARRGEAPAGAARRGREVACRDQPGVARRRSGEAQQGAARDAARAAAHRQPDPEGADGRHRRGQGKPRRPQLLRPGDGDSRVPRGRLGVAGPARGRRHGVRQDGSAREDCRKRPRQSHRRSAGVTLCRRASGRDVRRESRRALGTREPGAMVRERDRHAPLRRDVPVRQARRPVEGRLVGAADDRRARRSPTRSTCLDRPCSRRTARRTST